MENILYLEHQFSETSSISLFWLAEQYKFVKRKIKFWLIFLIKNLLNLIWGFIDAQYGPNEWRSKDGKWQNE